MLHFLEVLNCSEEELHPILHIQRILTEKREMITKIYPNEK